ncbi:MAG TPA: DUF484 family protein [Burkholderiales bacterium]|nr:DUF484 family protein [Burkholderiales bacterium]
MKPEEVAGYLKAHPEFFEQYAEALAEIFIPHPHGGRAIPISERQIVTLREKNRQIEGKLREVIQYGEENDAISEKVHRISVALLAASELRGVLNAVYLNLREDFAVPHVALRLWRGGNRADLPEFKPVTDAAREFAEKLAQPLCGSQAMDDTGGWFGEAGAHLRSFSYLPLRNGGTFGLLALASEDPQRFYPEMGTLYLKRLGELVGAALARHIK